MADLYQYQVPGAAGPFEFKEQSSRFLALLSPASTPEEAARHLDGLRKRYHDATHHCWAWRCGWGETLKERCSDDGEPSGTAGQPILRSLQEMEVSDASLVVVRWFGGVKLGTGGLARAYRTAARGVLAPEGLVTRLLTQTLICEMPYNAQGLFRRSVERAGGMLRNETFGESWSVEAEIPLRTLAEFAANLGELRELWRGALRWKSK